MYLAFVMASEKGTFLTLSYPTFIFTVKRFLAMLFTVENVPGTDFAVPCINNCGQKCTLHLFSLSKRYLALILRYLSWVVTAQKVPCIDF